MIKTILRLLAASTSFVALLLITNSAIALTEPTGIELPQLSLNLISPSLQLASDRSNTLSEHLGCSCAVCTQSIQASQI